MKRRLLFTALACAAGFSVVLLTPNPVRVFAQNRMQFPIVSGESGHIPLGLALRKLTVSGTFMQAPAHPDDETNPLFAMFGYGMGLRAIDLQNNRGEGGQNEIGPELFRDIGVLRTAELLSAHRIDGAEQYFTRALDYGYSFDPQEVINKWGRQTIVGDYVRLIRTLRPDVTVTMNIQGRGGDRAHEATTILFREAYDISGDPNRYPEQIEEGLKPWKAKKLYFNGGAGVIGSGGRGGPDTPGARGGGANGGGPQTQTAPGVKLTRVNTGAYDTLLGRTYVDIGSDAHSNHKCQGTGGLPQFPGVQGGRGGGPPGGAGYQLMETTIPGQMGKDENGLFDNIDYSLASIAQFAGANPPAVLTSALAEIAADGKKAQDVFATGNDAATAAPVEAGLVALRKLQGEIASLPVSDSAKYEISFRLNLKERDYEDAVLAAHNVTVDAVSDDGLVIGGQPVKLSFAAINRTASDVNVTSVAVAGFDGPGSCPATAVKKDVPFTCSIDAHIPKTAKLTTPYFYDNYWKHPENAADENFEPGVGFGLPFAPSPFRATFHIRAGSVDVTKELPIQYRYVKDIYNGDKRMEINVVPSFSVKVSPPLAVIPLGNATAKPGQREIHVAVTNGTKGAATATVALNVPAGWKVTPPTSTITFSHEDEALSARFDVTPPAQVPVGEYSLEAVVTSSATGSDKFNSGYQEIEYPHIMRRQVIKPAQVSVKVVDVKVAPNVNVGYIVGVGDQVPPALEQLGAKVSYIDENELAGGNLSKYDVIITGVRAYERRADLRAYNHRLLDYAEKGGVVVVQYNKMEFNQSEYGPFPAKVSGNRVSDETVPVKILVPDHPVFNFPNKIGPATWANWTQERGLYFLGDKDPKYVDLVSMVDSFPDNPGEKLGSFVEGRAGKGRWIYLGLGLWRQLPAGTDGSYQLLANLISLPKAPAARPRK
jgi:NPCBM-associated, NEW3 domain of alpha-galactosidase